MRYISLQPASLCLGAALALTVSGMSQKSAETPEPRYEYQILTDVEGDELPGLAKEGWEFAGYLGQSKKGASSDETLWRRIDP